MNSALSKSTVRLVLPYQSVARMASWPATPKARNNTKNPKYADCVSIRALYDPRIQKVMHFGSQQSNYAYLYNTPAQVQWVWSAQPYTHPWYNNQNFHAFMQMAYPGSPSVTNTPRDPYNNSFQVQWDWPGANNNPNQHQNYNRPVQLPRKAQPYNPDTKWRNPNRYHT